VVTGAQLAGRAFDRGLDGLVGLTASTVSMEALDSADLVVVAGVDPAQAAPVVDFRLHQALLRGAKVVYIGPLSVGAGAKATVSVTTDSAAPVAVALLRRLATEGGFDRPYLRERCSGFDRLEYHLRSLSEEELLDAGSVDMETLVSAALCVRSVTGRVIGIAGGGVEEEGALRVLTLLLLCLGKLGVEGSGLIMLRAEANDQGMPAVGLHPEFLPGRIAAKGGSLGATRTALGTVQAALVVGDDPLGTAGARPMAADGVDLVVLDALPTATTGAAQVVLPISAPAETSGRFLNFERRLIPLVKYADPPGGKETWKVLAALEARLGSDAGYGSLAELMCAVDGVLTGACGVSPTPEPSYLQRFLTPSGLAELGRPDVLAGVTKRAAAAQPTGTISRWVGEYLAHAQTGPSVED
jgi:predicted molibdopterin-dependent oxidoreductase YjgC